ncbi:sensor histidine kinase [Paracoccus sp. ME4]|uniref:sensor histidine kinase n=1 Tax=Paracoccus sp. ME4 TaxID=3138066 RepID=UPI00398B38EC
MSDIPVLQSRTHLRPGWQGLGLLRRHLSNCALIVVVGLAILGVWTASRLQHAVEAEVGHRAATVLETMLSRHAADLSGDRLPPELSALIDAHFRDVSGPLGLSEMKIWRADGTILYASRPGLTGTVQPVEEALASALSGQVSVSVGETFHEDADHPPTTAGTRQFEIYVPIRLRPLDRIVAVAEYYQDAAVASDALTRARWQTWGLLAAIGAMFVAVMVLILRHGDAIILRQRIDLGARMADMMQLLDRTEAMQARIQRRTLQIQEEQKAQIRQINADIHDGIGQLLTVALLRMTASPPGGSAQEEGAQAVRLILEEAMSEVHALLNGTSQHPASERPLAEAVRALVDDHCRRTATTVRLLLEPDLPEPRLSVKAAICRVVQEGLHNAFKHAGGRDQCVSLHRRDGRLIVTVCNDARHCRTEGGEAARPPMGLRNLRHRVETLGGTFRVLDQADHRMEIHASFPDEDMEDAHG